MPYSTRLSINGYQVDIKPLPPVETDQGSWYKYFSFSLTTPDRTKLFGTKDDVFPVVVYDPDRKDKVKYPRDAVALLAMRVASRPELYGHHVRNVDHYGKEEYEWLKSAESRRLYDIVRHTMISMNQNPTEYVLEPLD